MLSPMVTGIIREFMSRATLNGKEVGAYNMAMSALAAEDRVWEVEQKLRKEAADKAPPEQAPEREVTDAQQAS